LETENALLHKGNPLKTHPFWKISMLGFELSFFLVHLFTPKKLGKEFCYATFDAQHIFST